MYGSDQAASIEARNLKTLGQVLKNVNNILGDGKKRIYEGEKEARKKLRIEAE